MNAANVTQKNTISPLTKIWNSYGMLLIFFAIFIGSCIFIPNFATVINMKGLGLSISMSGMVACGMLFCLAAVSVPSPHPGGAPRPFLGLFFFVFLGLHLRHMEVPRLGL